MGAFAFIVLDTGDGNFAVVLKLKDKQKHTEYALKIIDKSKCSGKVKTDN